MPVDIRGKSYMTVAERINDFRAEHKEWGIETELVAAESNVIMKAIIKNKEGHIVGTGFAEEVRGSTNINKTSALENCETSAIGRALASVGFGGTEYATANEVTDAILQQKVMEATEKLLAHNKAVVRNIDSIYAIKTHIANGEFVEALTVMADVDDEDRAWLNVAPTKGGIFTTNEIAELKKTNKLREANNG